MSNTMVNIYEILLLFQATTNSYNSIISQYLSWFFLIEVVITAKCNNSNNIVFSWRGSVKTLVVDSRFLRLRILYLRLFLRDIHLLTIWYSLFYWHLGINLKIKRNILKLISFWYWYWHYYALWLTILMICKHYMPYFIYNTIFHECELI